MTADNHGMPTSQADSNWKLRVLLVQDNEPEAVCVNELLAQVEESLDVEHKRGLGDALRCLDAGEVDAILLDPGLSDSSGIETVRRLQISHPQVPVILLVPPDDEQLAVQAVLEGADDYLTKGRFDGRALWRAIRRAVEFRHTLRLLRQSETRYRVLAKDQTEFICRRRPNGVLTFVNDAYCRCFGKTPNQLVGTNFRPPVVLENRIDTLPEVVHVDAETPTVTYESRVLVRGDDERWHQWRERVIMDDMGNVVEVHYVGRDVTALKNAEQDLKLFSLADELTGLYIKEAFVTLAEQALKVAQRNRRHLMILVVLIDGLESIQADWGPSHGDRALLELAGILRDNLRQSDIIGRLEENEFGVVALEAEMEGSLAVTARILNAIRARNEKAKDTFPLGATIGCAWFDPTSPASLTELLAHADEAIGTQKQRKDVKPGAKAKGARTKGARTKAKGARTKAESGRQKKKA